MGAVTAALSAVGAFCKAVALGLGIIHDNSERKAGTDAQVASDLSATVKADQESRNVESSNASLDRDALLERLHDQSGPGGQ